MALEFPTVTVLKTDCREEFKKLIPGNQMVSRLICFQ